MEVFYYLVLGTLAVVVAGIELDKSGKDRVTTSLAFNSFKNNYIPVYSLMMSGDWLQGLYVLVRSSGLTKESIENQEKMMRMVVSSCFGAIILLPLPPPPLTAHLHLFVPS